LPLLLSAIEKQQIPFYSFWLDPIEAWTIYHTWG